MRPAEPAPAVGDGPRPAPDAPAGWSPVALARGLAAYGVHIVATALLIVLVGALGLGSGDSESFYFPAEGLALVGGYGVLVAGTLVAARALGSPRDVLGLRAVRVGQTIGLVVLTYVLVTTANLIVFEPLFRTSEAQDVTPGPWPGGADAVAGVALTAVVFAVGAPLAEELFFRGLLHRGFGADRAGVAGWAGLAIGALLFAALHFQPGAIPALFTLGVALGLLRRRTGSLWPAIGLHALNNAAATAAVFAAAWSWP